jgi:hypothetical protein
MTIIPLSNLDWDIITKVIRDTRVLLAGGRVWLAGDVEGRLRSCIGFNSFYFLPKKYKICLAHAL